MGTLLDRMEPLLAAMPAVKSPEGHVHFKNKLLWTAGILILYFVMTNIPLWDLIQIPWISSNITGLCSLARVVP